MRKNVLFFFAPLMLVLASCSTSKAPFVQDIAVFDYTEASQNGKILITEAPSVAFDYTSLASIVVRETSGYEVTGRTVETKIVKEFGETFDSPPVMRQEPIERLTFGGFRSASPRSALKAAAAKALEIGGDAIIGLKVSPVIEGTAIDGYIVSGMVVKRK